ncbi:MAG: hypothetical protein Kow0092_38940 [Deferrisomatales bacterium]
MADLFLSYAREDRAAAERLAASLEAAGFSVWWDREVAAGEPFAQVIEGALREARTVVVLWSRHSVGSTWVQAEATEGLERRILVPVRLDESAPPLVFRTVQTADLTGWTGDPADPRLARLTADLGQRLGRPPPADKATEGARPRRGRLRRPLGWAAAALAVLLGIAAIWGGWSLYAERRHAALAGELTARSAALLRRVAEVRPEERGTYWWRRLETGQRTPLLERSVLLAVEALRRRPSDEARRALDRGLALLQRPTLEVPGAGTPGSLAWAPDGTALAAITPEGAVAGWNPPRAQQLFTWPLGDRWGALAWGTDGRYLVAADGAGAVRRWDPKTGKETGRAAPASEDVTTVLGPTGARAVWLAPHEARVVDIETGRLAVRIPLPSPPSAAALDAAGTRLAVAGRDRLVRVWALPAGETAAVLETGTRVEALAFAGGRPLLAGAAADGSARLWDLAAGEELVRVGHDDRVVAVAWSADATRLATGSQDGTARVWDAATGAEEARLPHRDTVHAVAFRPDGRLLATASQEGRVRAWVLGPDDPVDEACRRLTRNLSPEEWREALGQEPYRKTCPERP